MRRQKNKLSEERVEFFKPFVRQFEKQFGFSPPSFILALMIYRFLNENDKANNKERDQLILGGCLK